MYFLITLALATAAGAVWGWTQHTWHMPYWMILAFALGPALAAEVIDRTRKKRALRRQTADRAVVVHRWNTPRQARHRKTPA